MVVHSLSAGGAERVLAVLGSVLARRGHSVVIVTVHDGDPDFYELHEGIQRVALGLTTGRKGLWSGIRHNLWRQRRLRSALLQSKPDVVVAFMSITNVRVLHALRGTKIPVIATEHVDPHLWSPGWVWSILRRVFYPGCARLVCVSRGVERGFRWMRADRCAVIYNPLPDIDESDSDESRRHLMTTSRRRVIAMGRLVPQKGFDLLIQAFAAVADLYLDWDLLILGEGGQRAELEDLIRKMGLSGRANLAGNYENPFGIIKRSDLFVLSSRFEGFGNALTEAMACGLAAISFDCPSGPAEIIQNGRNGVLVPAGDVMALARAMSQLMGDEPERRRLAAAALDVCERFSQERILDEWEEVLRTATERNGDSSENAG